MNLKERLDNYAQQPDPEVWDSISSSMRQPLVRRRAVGLSLAAVTLVGLGLAFLLGRQAQSPEPSSAHQAPVVVSQLSQPQSTSAQVQEDQPQASSAATAAVIPSTAPAATQATSATVAAQPVQAPAPVAATPAAPDVKATPAPIAETSKASTPAKVVTPAKTVAPATAPTVAAKAVAPAPATASTPATATAPAQNSTKVVPAVTEDEVAFWQPNAFAPGDPYGSSPYWYLTLKDGRHIKSFKIYIYNRAGRQVFKSNDYTQRWDGTLNGQALPSGTYTYIYEYYDIDLAKICNSRGTITLIR